MFSKKSPDEVLEGVLSALKSALGENLYSAIVYGSYVRGNFVKGVSDLNLLIVLKESTAEAHQALGNVVREFPLVDPFVLEVRGIERSMKVFALKFMSIQRNHKLLHGEDFFKKFELDLGLEKFLCEQAIRNLRMRFVHRFHRIGHERKRYSNYLRHLTSSIFVNLSEIPRILREDVPQDYTERVKVIENSLGFGSGELSVLSELIEFHQTTRTLSDEEIFNFHTRIFRMLNAVVFWIEEKWELPVPSERGAS